MGVQSKAHPSTFIYNKNGKKFTYLLLIKALAQENIPKSIVNCLTDCGHSSAKLTMLNHNEADQQYIEEYMDNNPNLILVLHREADENPLLGYFCPESDTYFYVQTHEVRAF